MSHERVSRPLGRLAELLVENDARVSLNEIRDLLEATGARARAEGFQEGERNAKDQLAGITVGLTSFGPTSTVGLT
jgi:hypothetical protein